MLADRLAKRMKHLTKWARKKDITCFRLYERDIPEYPIVIDWYADLGAEDPSREGDAIAWFHDRKRDDDLDDALAYRRAAETEILSGLDITRSRLFIKHRGRQRSGDGDREQYEKIESNEEIRFVLEHGSKFEINLTDYLDVGLFLDHRPTRLAVRERAAGRRVLNLFAYTGAFSVHARAGGAAMTTTVDMSRTYLDWYERNLQLNGFELDLHHRSIHADCLQWLEEGPSGDDRYDLVICDPPTFSNSKRMKAGSFAIDRDYPQLLSWISRFVAPGGEIFFSTNSRSFELDRQHVPENFGAHEISHRSVPEDFRNRRIHRCWRLAEGWKPKGSRSRPTQKSSDDQGASS
jgi:23S rRNA G2069 N7-methylase RlmK/C1962 C5-methylase RlmI